MNWTYWLIDAGTIAIPFLFSFHPRIRFFEHFTNYLAAAVPVGIVFIIWDAWFTHLGVWGFNSRYLLGPSILGLPMEECLFFLCIPFSCQFTIHVLRRYRPVQWKKTTLQRVTILLSALLLALALFSFGKMYTTITCAALGIALPLACWLGAAKSLGDLLAYYPVLLIPFFIVNGILTGTGLDEPVVWYNNTENLSIRIGTIPVEDVVYGFLLLLLNLVGYDMLLPRKINTPSV
ncbi:MAG: lycopene cyclase domain-containing protein [Chitinophagales bacterium]